MAIENRTKYWKISKKLKINRTDKEEDFIQKNWHKYYITKIRNTSFKIGAILFSITLLFDYIIKQG